MDKSINVSDRNFHNRITGKYHKGKRNPYKFPLMIFFRNPGKLLSQKINLNVLLQFNISKKITTQHILKSAEGIISLLEWFRIERYIPKYQKFSSQAPRSKGIPVFMSFAFEKISSALDRIINPLYFNSEEAYFKKYDLLQKEEFLSDINSINTNKTINNTKIINGKKILNENLLNSSEDISSADNSVSWDYKFVFHNESPFILQHVNSLLRNSKLANYLNYPEVLNDITKSIITKSNAYISNYIQIINHGMHHGFEPVILQHVNLLLNSMPIQGLTSKEYLNFSKLDNKYHVILPHVNLLLNSVPIQGLTSKDYLNFSKLDNKYHVIQPHVNLLLNTISANNIVSFMQEFSKEHASGQRFVYSFRQDDLKGQEFAGDNKIYFPKAQLSNNQMRNIRLRNNQDQKNIPEMILSHSKSFPTSIKHDPEKNNPKALSVLMPSIIKPVLKDDTRGQTRVNLEHLIKSDASTENYDLHFKTNRKIEEEIENVKRIAQEAKQTVIESVKDIQTSHEEEMNRKIDISRLSDQVYRLLDRKITIEKERRGYI